MKQAFYRLAGVYGRLAALTLLVGALLRIALLFNGQTTDLHFTLGGWLLLFVAGAINDLCVATLTFAPLWLYMITVSEAKYRRPQGYILLALLGAAFLYLLGGNTPVHEFGRSVARIVTIVLGYWCGTFALRLFVPRVRPWWSRAWFFVITTLCVGAILFNGVSEYLFWNEFGVRYNFIAVDYLVYTSEVVGNIIESYPVWPILGALLLATLAVRQLLFGRYRRIEELLNNDGWKAIALPAYAAAVLVSLGVLQFNLRFQQSRNVYLNELQANGLQRFCDAFLKNELDYDRFYVTRPADEIEAFLRATYGSDRGVARRVQGSGEELRRNIVLITMESMSADFMARFGNTEGLTPVLDSLYGCGLAFDRLYATGNRTVRGLEAVTLSLPPAAGQSIIKRPDNTAYTSVGEILADKGYEVLYFYGGNSYFDNMESFFGGNGYRIVDQKCYTPDEITFANIWGVADEDNFRKAIRTLDTLAAGNRPFFAHIMTVSNHRPFTYPAGRIPIPNDSKSRAGGVMYSDYALGEFFRAAAREPWFDRTIFLVTADHCASSAGKTELPLEKYHIPAVIIAPGLVEPQVEPRIVSQIDLMPTLLSLLQLDYESPFYGRSVLEPDYAERAFVATYQSLGYIEPGRLTVLSPVRRVEQYAIRPTAENPHNTEPLDQPDPATLERAVAYYQSAAAR